MKAMKYTEVPESLYQDYVENDQYWFQQKMDGTRVLMTWKPGQSVEFFQRDGKPLKYAAAALHIEALQSDMTGLFHAAAEVYAQPLITMQNRLTFDGELVISEDRKPTLYVWDVLDSVKPQAIYSNRHQILSRIVDEAVSQSLLSGLVVQSLTVSGTDQKRQFLDQAREANVEGVMAKWQYEVYRPGERTDTTVKLKFVKEADVVVLEWSRGTNEAGREVGSAEFGVYSDYNEPIVPVGRCSLIGKPKVHTGDVITVKYLYWTGAAVVQPRMVSVRLDKAPHECGMTQFSPYSRDAL